MIDHKCTEEKFAICENSNKCHLCFEDRLYKEPKWLKIKHQQEKRRALSLPKKRKGGMSFEKSVAKRINKKLKPDSQRPSASRRPNSGAIWSMPGDIITKEQLIECKERGSKNSRGESQITIQKIQLSKIQAEALLAKKAPYYVFSFKDDEDFYVVKDFNTELELLEQIEILKARIVELERGII